RRRARAPLRPHPPHPRRQDGRRGRHRAAPPRALRTPGVARAWRAMTRLRPPEPMAKLAGMRVAAAALAAGLAMPCGAGVVRADDAGAQRLIIYADDVITVRLAKMPVTDVLAEIGRQSGAEIRGDVKTPHDVSAEFDAVPVAEAVHRLLGNENFALI